MKKRSIVLFDGICNLCNSAVQFIIKRDKKNKFQFASLQSETGKNLIKAFDLPESYINSFVLIEDEKIYTRSAAALHVAKKLNGLWPILYAFIIAPVFIRDGIYKWIAKNRYKWFGSQNECMLPASELKSKFLN